MKDLIKNYKDLLQLVADASRVKGGFFSDEAFLHVPAVELQNNLEALQGSLETLSGEKLPAPEVWTEEDFEETLL